MTEQVYTLLVELGRKAGDGLPAGASGAAMLCYASGATEKAAVDATVAVLGEAGLAPLEVESYGSRADREADGETIDPEDAILMDRALAENAVIVAQVTTFEN